MAKKSKGAFADAQAAVAKAFHDLERAVKGMVSTPAKPKKAKTKKTRAKKKAAKKR